jgi:hypothetical protein
MRNLVRTLATGVAVATASTALAALAGPAAASDDPLAATRDALSHAAAATGSPGVALPAVGDSLTVGRLTIGYPAPAHRSASLNATTRVFDGPAYDQIVQSTGAESVRLLTVLPDAAAPTRYAYTFPGHRLRLADDGSVTVLDHAEPVARIDPAWARDARGQVVATHYEVHGERLVQVVDVTDATAFPVVADPSIHYHWWGFDIRFSRSETRTIATSTSACTVVAGTIPDPTASKVVAAVCGALTLWADAASDRGKCIAIKKPWVGGVIPWYWSC